jgi:hypothetical protein
VVGSCERDKPSGSDATKLVYTPLHEVCNPHTTLKLFFHIRFLEFMPDMCMIRIIFKMSVA